MGGADFAMFLIIQLLLFKRNLKLAKPWRNQIERTPDGETYMPDLRNSFETRTPLPMAPGRPARFDYEYKRNGTANMFMAFAPLEGWRHVKVTKRRTRISHAQFLKELADVHWAQAEKITLVQDNLNTHNPASLYQAFEPAEARRIMERFEWHYTPKHGSWLNMAESELSVLSGQCLARRIENIDTLSREVAAWTAHRNQHNAKAEWHFTTTKARIKLKSLYPTI